MIDYEELPQELREITRKFQWEEITIGVSTARTFKLSHDSLLYYLKIGFPSELHSLDKEKRILNWIKHRLPVPDIIYFSSLNDKEYLLMTEILGDVSFSDTFGVDKKEVLSIVAQGLRTIHELDITNCPIEYSSDFLLSLAKRKIQQGCISTSNFDTHWRNFTPHRLFQELVANKPTKDFLSFTHGDFCLPNILIHNNSLSGFIDWGYAGVGDYYSDLTSVLWSIQYNFGSKWWPFFLSEYGIEDVDWKRILFYRQLNEFF